MCLSVISTYPDTCEISSATVVSRCQPIPNQIRMLAGAEMPGVVEPPAQVGRGDGTSVPGRLTDTFSELTGEWAPWGLGWFFRFQFKGDLEELKKK